MSREAMKLALEALEKLQWSLEQADCSTGYCCCGSSVDGHTFGDGHSPVDEGEYCQSNALEYSRKAITAIKQALAEPVYVKTFHGGKPWPLHPAPVQEQVFKPCSCRWKGEEQVQQCTLHAAHIEAIHEWAERAKTAEAKLKERTND